MMEAGVEVMPYVKVSSLLFYNMTKLLWNVHIYTCLERLYVAWYEKIGLMCI